MKEREKYDRIMSFGCMCSTAIFLRKHGYRSESTFFDWISSSLESNFMLLDNNFSQLLNKKYLIQPYKEFPHIVDNTFYNVSLNHMFDEHKTFEKQIKQVERFCQKRINRFLNNLTTYRCLLVYYSRDYNECQWICNHADLIKEYCVRYSFDILFITNHKLDETFPFSHFLIPINNIHKPYGGGVSFPFEEEDMIVEYLDTVFDAKQKKMNLHHKEKRHFIKKIINRVFKKNVVKLKIG